MATYEIWATYLEILVADLSLFKEKVGVNILALI